MNGGVSVPRKRRVELSKHEDVPEHGAVEALDDEDKELVYLPVKEYISDAQFRRQIVVYLLAVYSFLLLATVAIILFQGFHFGGFSLDNELLKWLGCATIGEIGGFVTLTIRASFK
jgi:hypothetical protein